VTYYYFYIKKSTSIDNFVPSNTHDVPDLQDWNKTYKNFGTLVEKMNNTHYQISYDMENILSAFVQILNSDAEKFGKFTILSVGDTKPFTLFNVLVQNVETLLVIKFTRVDFILDSMNPYIIKNVAVTLDDKFRSSQFITGAQELQNSTMFRIKNPLHLFAPYDTSDNEMIRTTYDFELLEKVVKDKQKELNKF